MSEWISVKERRPTEGEDRDARHVHCLVYSKMGITLAAWNPYYLVWDDDDEDDVSYINDDITHWMPLPPPPGEKGKE